MQIQQPFYYNEVEVMYYDFIEALLVNNDLPYSRPYADSGIFVTDDVYNKIKPFLQPFLEICLYRQRAVRKAALKVLPNSHF